MICYVPQEVPESTDNVGAKAPSPVMKQSNERMCSCDPHESCPSCSPSSPASSLQEESAVPADDVIHSSSSHLLDQLSSPKVRHSDQSNSSQKVRPTNPNYHLLQQLQKQLTFPSINLAASSCDQPLDLSFNSTRAQQPLVATPSSSSTLLKGPLDQNALLEVVSGSSDAVVLPAPPKYVSFTFHPLISLT